MWVRQGHIWQTVAIVGLMAALALAVMGCQAQPAQWSELGPGGARYEQQQQSQPRNRYGSIRIVAQSNREVADLSPDDVVKIMRRIGFTDEQILELGTELHDAMLTSGAVRVLDRDETEAIARVGGTQVYIGSRTRGNFVYDLGYGQFVTPGPRR
ncbi:MAG: hypothetical protein JSW27_05925 [Phycisphaerales bacterium]|nr:MAG: hypothetical protein JSW27_05925 [Phycisphaerales bacterium]